MATIVNDKDKLLQATTVRLLSSSNNYIYFNTPAPVFNLDSVGVATPTSYTITAQFAGQLRGAGTVTWSTVTGTVATTGQSGNNWTIAATDLTTNTAVIRASLLYLGVTYSADLTISKLSSGASAVFADLVSENDVIASEADGTGYTLPTGNALRLYSGGTIISTGVTYTGTATKNGLTLTVNNTTGTITLSGTGWTTNQESFTVTATYNSAAYTATYAIAKSKRGNDAILVDLVSDTDVVFAANNGTGYTLPTGNSVRLYKGGTVLTTGVTYSGTTTKNGLTLTVNTSTGELVLSGASWTSNQESFTVTAVYNLLSYTIIYTIAKSRTGAAGLSAILSNEVHVFPASTTGVVSSYINSGTEIRVYEGSTQLTYDGVGTTAGTWKIVATATNITIGTITDSGTFATVGQHSGVSAGVDTSSILYTITGVSNSGVSFTTTKNQTFSKSKIGETGANGVQTTEAIVYRWSTTIPTISGSSTYTWATGSVSSPPTNWFTTVSDTGTAGQTLWAAKVNLTESVTVLTTAVDWTTASIVPLGYVGTTGAVVRIAYTATTSTLDTNPSVYIVSGDNLPIVNSWNGAPVRVATTANITLSGLLTIDGVTLIANDRVLVKNQTLSQNNGIYVAASTGWTRATDTDTWNEFIGLKVFVSQGTVNANTFWQSNAAAGGTLGTTAITFTSASVPTVTWSTTTPVLTSGQSVWQSNGVYNPSTNQTIWETPYLASLKVGNLSALSTNTGSLTVSGNIKVGANGNISGGQTAYNTGSGFFLGYDATTYKFSIGSSTANMLWDGTNFTVNGGKISGGTIQIGTGNTPNLKAFEVNSAGAFWVDNIFGGIGSFSNFYFNSSAVTGYSENSRNYPATAGYVASGNASANAHGIRGQNTNNGSAGLIGGANGYDFYADGSGTNYGPFTGNHDILIPIDQTLEEGALVVDVQCIARNNWSNALFQVAPSTVANQAGARGVFVGQLRALSSVKPPAFISHWIDEGNTSIPVMTEQYEAIKDNYWFGSMNSIGEGQIQVCGENGNISVDTLIVSSNTTGVGMAQSDDIIRSKTVAKSREAVTFSSPTEVKIVACIYLCG